MQRTADMNTIDDDAKELGINQEIWKEFKEKKTYQDDLPHFLEVEARAREESIDAEAHERRRAALFRRWFGYYRKCKDQNKKIDIIKQYNAVCMMRARQR
jgi:hypothetical protein